MTNLRLLFVTNFYPPHDRGGYEKHCYEVATRLRAKGHTVFVLTSRYGVSHPVQDTTFCRSLFLESDIEHYSPAHFFLRRWREERHNAQTLLSTISTLQPDAVVFWGMWNLSRKLPTVAETTDVPIAYYLGDLWPISPDMHTQYWQLPTRRRSRQPLKSLASTLAFALLRLERYPPELRFEYVMCGSHFLKHKLSAAGLPFQHARVVMCGIDTQRFRADVNWHARRQRLHAQQNIRLLYVGALTPQKGVHTAIDALQILHNRSHHNGITLSIVGAGTPEQEMLVRKQIGENGLDENITLVGLVPNESLPALMAQHDVLVFPSIIEEGFGRVAVEAMAAGLVVVGTGVGGSAEILQDERNGLCFQPANAEQLATQVQRLSSDPDLYVRLASAGQETVLDRFDLSQMVDGIERYLIEVVRADQRDKGE